MTAARTRAVSVVAEAVREHRPVLGRGLTSPVGCGCMSRVFFKRQENYATHLAEAVVAALEAEMGLREERDMHDSADDTFPIARLVTDWIGDGDE